VFLGLVISYTLLWINAENDINVNMEIGTLLITVIAHRGGFVGTGQLKFHNGWSEIYSRYGILNGT
jgi:hypothetical protein